MNAPSDPTLHRETMLATLRSILIDELHVRIPAHALGPDVPLFGWGVGLDSVDGVELALAIEQRFGVEIPQDERFPVITRSLNGIVDHVLGAQARKSTLFPKVARAISSFAETLGLHAAPDVVPPIHGALRRSVACAREAEVAILELVADRADTLWEAVEQVFPCDLVVYDGQAKPALLLHESGVVRADVTLAKVHGRVLLFAEGIGARDLLQEFAPWTDRLRLRDLGPEVVMVGLHGPFAWEVVGAWLGRHVSVLPPLGVCQLPSGVTVLRSGRTGEYGFEVMLPAARATELLAQLDALAARFEIEPISPDELAAAIVEAGGFSARALLARGLTAAELQLEWRLSRKRRRAREPGAKEARRSILFVAPQLCSGVLRQEGREVGEVVFSRARADGSAFGLAVLEAPLSHPGLTVVDERGVTAQTHSAPLVRPRSLGVRPQVDRFERRP